MKSLYILADIWCAWWSGAVIAPYCFQNSPDDTATWMVLHGGAWYLFRDKEGEKFQFASETTFLMRSKFA